jgi:cyanophycinase
MSRKRTGRLIIIGGGEDKHHDRALLRQVVEEAQRMNGKIVVATVATHLPDEVFADYQQAFADLDFTDVEALDVRSRAEACDPSVWTQLDEAGVVFFTGGDQLRIASQIGGSPFHTRLQAFYAEGGVIVGTSAGAAVMPETMLVSGSSDASLEVEDLEMAPGLGFLRGVVIDSHFAQRGRMSRLLSAVARNPMNIGIGIDEDTAILVNSPATFEVAGSGAVYIVCGREISYSGFGEKAADGILSIFDTRVHVLSAGDRFDLTTRRPEARPRPEQYAAAPA